MWEFVDAHWVYGAVALVFYTIGSLQGKNSMQSKMMYLNQQHDQQEIFNNYVASLKAAQGD